MALQSNAYEFSPSVSLRCHLPHQRKALALSDEGAVTKVTEGEKMDSAKGIPQFLIPNLKGAIGSFYFAYSTARVSLTTFTFI